MTALGGWIFGPENVTIVLHTDLLAFVHGTEKTPVSAFYGAWAFVLVASLETHEKVKFRRTLRVYSHFDGVLNRAEWSRLPGFIMVVDPGEDDLSIVVETELRDVVLLEVQDLPREHIYVRQRSFPCRCNCCAGEVRCM